MGSGSGIALITSGATGATGSADVSYATSMSGTSLVMGIVKVTAQTLSGGGEATVDCKYVGTGVVASSNPSLVLQSSPRGMSQMTIVAKISAGARAVLSCTASIDDGTATTVSAQWQGGIGHTIGSNTDNNKFGDSAWGGN